MKYSILTIFLGSIIAFSSCQNSPTEPTKVQGNTAPSSKIQTVEVVKPSTRSFDAQMQISGTAMPNQKAMIHAMESGYLRQISKDIGDKVKKGEVLARLENPEIAQQLAQAEADLAIAEATLQTLKSELKSATAESKISTTYFNRLKGISEKTPALTPIVEVEKAEASAEMARANVGTMQAKIKAHQQRIEAVKKQVQFAKVRGGMLAIKAPFSGIITGRYLDVGAMVQSGISNSGANAIFEIQDIDPIRLTLSIPESNAAAVRKGMEVNVTFPELAGADFKAKVSRTANALDAGSKTMQAEIDIPNPKGNIISGMYAKAKMQINSRQNVLSLPLTAISLYQDLPHALAVKNDRVVLIPLRKGLAGKDYFEILNSEITAETMVIVQGKGLVKEGDLVKPILKK